MEVRSTFSEYGILGSTAVITNRSGFVPKQLLIITNAFGRFINIRPCSWLVSPTTIANDSVRVAPRIEGIMEIMIRRLGDPFMAATIDE